MDSNNKSEKGQVLILIVLALVAMFGLVSLAIDGGMALSDRRQGQNAADAAALFAAREYAQSLTAVTGASQDQVRANTAINGYTHDGTNTIVTLATQPAIKKCPDERTASSDGIDFTVTIQSTIRTAFAPVVGIDQVKNTVSATVRGCKSVWSPIFPGDAIVGLEPNGDSVYINGNASWIVHGGGVYANNNFNGKCGKTFELDPGYAVTASGTADCVPAGIPEVTGVPQLPFPSSPYTDPNNTILQMLPKPEPPCDGTAAGGIVVPTNPTSFTFKDGVYCVDNFDAFASQDIVLSNAMLYVRDTDFNIKFAGGGTAGHGFAGTGITTGPYTGLYIYIKMADPNTHHQEMEWRGNGYAGITGTILAPTTIVDLRGNSNGVAMNSQIVAYRVETLGTANVTVSYNAAQNFNRASKPNLQLLK